MSLNQEVIEDFRAHAGQASSGRFVGTPLLLLSTIGARTGLERLTPLAYTRDGERYVVIASNGGSTHHPAWFHNLLAHELVTVEVGTERFAARVKVSVEPERSRLYSAQATLLPNFAKHALATTRQIPVVILERMAS
jgi:deazaflavin-dependent oxidoreductase (nitroreductase family)